MLFDDRLRGAKAALAVAMILALGAYYAYIAANMESGWRWCLEDPAGRDGAALAFPLWTVTRVDGPDRYEISKIISGVPVQGDATPLAVGDTVSVAGHFDAAHTVVVEEAREVHVLRRWKEALSVLGFVLVALAAPFSFRVRAGRVEERRWRI